MKTKTFFMLAVMLLISMDAFAQSNEPLEGDVNNDGTVDVADIVKVIDIMQNGGGIAGQTKCYWYVGTTAIDDTNYNDTNIVSQVTEIPNQTTVTLNDEYLYIVVPKEKTVTVIDTGSNLELGTKTYNSSTHTFTNAVTYVGDYSIYRSASTVDGTARITITE